ncbi:hypothetical protein QBC39DRAFT_356186 [Podospora conica]|nr:hypothetical protein QBC39DRAFT_356186 [Schizothecium conicum]
MSTPQEPTTTSSSSSVDYKAQLDELATKAREPPQSTESQEEKKPEGTGAVIVEKVSQIIPAVKKVLGGGGDDEQQQRDNATPEKTAAPSGPPDRPVHDPHIAEFLRDQHKSIELTDKSIGE